MLVLLSGCPAVKMTTVGDENDPRADRLWADKGPDCSGVDRWATNMVFVHLRNAGIVDNERVDFSKTVTTQLASERTGKDLWRQVHLVTITENSGKVIQAISINDASYEECSMSAVDVFVVSKHVGDS
jgi:hypothetical protein